MEHLVEFLFEHPFIIFIVPLAFTVFFGFIVSLVLAVGLFWARHVLAERRRETEERRLERASRLAEKQERSAERASRETERQALRDTWEVQRHAWRRNLDEEYAEIPY
jgi:ABC-type protease/lipase transport system fused ATPase/permease subunit